MNGLNPNLVLRAIVLVVLAAIAVLAFIVSRPEPVSDQVIQAGIVSALVGGVITSLLALLQATRARESASDAHQAINGTQDELEAAQARIAFLEEQQRAAGGGRRSPPAGGGE